MVMTVEHLSRTATSAVPNAEITARCAECVHVNRGQRARWASRRGRHRWPVAWSDWRSAAMLRRGIWTAPRTAHWIASRPGRHCRVAAGLQRGSVLVWLHGIAPTVR